MVPYLQYKKNLNSLFKFLEMKEDIGKIFIIGGSLLYTDIFTNYSPMIDVIYYTKVITTKLSDQEYLLALNNNSKKTLRFEKTKR